MVGIFKPTLLYFKKILANHKVKRGITKDYKIDLVVKEKGRAVA